MATTRELEDQIAALTERVAYLESRDPKLAHDRKLAESRDRKARLTSLDLKGHRLLSSPERDTWCSVQSDKRLVELLAEAKPTERDELLALLPWQRKATIVFALAPAPSLVEVAVHASFETRHFVARKGETLILDADRWLAQCEREPRIAEWLADGALTERTLPDDKARRYALNAYLQACLDKRGLPGAVVAELPSP